MNAEKSHNAKVASTYANFVLLLLEVKQNYFCFKLDYKDIKQDWIVFLNQVTHTPDIWGTYGLTKAHWYC
jgi:hypothetical protein